jgi:type VI secretion system secreted protein VgrG
LKGTFAPREYCVQYRETDFDFVSRLMEEEGIYYFFKHVSNGHTLVVTDSPDGLTPLSAPISYDPTGAARRDAGVIYAWEKDQELRSGLVTLRDYAFQIPDETLEVQAQIQESVLAGKVTHHLHVAGNEAFELYDYPGDYAKRFDNGDPAVIVADGQRTAAIRMQEEALPSLQVNGGANAARLTTGNVFTLQHHFDANGAWVVTSVDHTAHATNANGPVTYTNDFTCIPAALPFRPSRTTPKPSIHGVQTAVVVGPGGEEIYTDKYGRVKVQFHWDRDGKKDDKSSGWIRVAHPTVSPGSQAPPPPSIGAEVVVAFEDGDPDRPLVIGTVDNTVRQPPP